MEIQERNTVPDEIEFYKEDKWLCVALKRYNIDKIPSNIILDKTLTGIGATTMELDAKRNSIIIEPNVPVIKGKTNSEICAIYKGVKTTTVKKYLQNTKIKYKKILTTPESFWKIRDAAKEAEIDIYSEDWFCLYDESEKITQDVEFRKRIIAPINDFFTFKNKAFISATPLDITHIEFINQGFKKVKVRPQFNYQKQLTLITTNDFAFKTKEKIESLKDSKCVCVFYNTISGITALISTLGIKSKSKIFCSDESMKKLKPDGYNVDSKISLPLEKYNFFSSSFFSALDIDIREKADVLILVNLYQARHSIIDPFTEAIQIQGRFRHEFEDGKTYNSLTFITNIDPYSIPSNPEQIKITIEQGMEIFSDLREKKEILRQEMEKETDQNRKEELKTKVKACTKDLMGLEASKLLDEDGRLNYFAIDNLYNEERTKGYYISEEALLKAFNDTGYFDITHISDMPLYRFTSQYFISNLSRKTDKSFMQAICKEISYLPPEELESSRILWLKYVDKDSVPIVDWTFEAFSKLGVETFERCKYDKKRIQKELDKHNDKEKCDSKEVVKEIANAMELGKKIEKTVIQKKLQSIYRRYGITKKVSQDTIKGYYKVLENNNGKPYTFELLYMLPKYAALL